MNIEQDVYFHTLIESHLQIEKQQILKAYSNGMINGITNHGMNSYQYYKERYEKQKILTKTNNMKDLNLKEGDKCYIGREKCTCIGVENLYSDNYPYLIKLKNKRKFYITKDGRYDLYLHPVVSLEPYDLPEMVYEKPFEVGKPHYFWDNGDDEGVYVSYGILTKIDFINGCKFYFTGTTPFECCSATPPELPLKNK